MQEGEHLPYQYSHKIRLCVVTVQCIVRPGNIVVPSKNGMDELNEITKFKEEWETHTA